MAAAAIRTMLQSMARRWLLLALRDLLIRYLPVASAPFASTFRLDLREPLPQQFLVLVRAVRVEKRIR
jgi:hypothetical protein